MWICEPFSMLRQQALQGVTNFTVGYLVEIQKKNVISMWDLSICGISCLPMWLSLRSCHRSSVGFFFWHENRFDEWSLFGLLLRAVLLTFFQLLHMSVVSTFHSLLHRICWFDCLLGLTGATSVSLGSPVLSPHAPEWVWEMWSPAGRMIEFLL